MDSYDMQEYIHFTKNILPSINIEMTIRGNKIVLMYGKEILGHFDTLKEAWHFATGFEIGLAKGKCGTFKTQEEKQ